MNIPQSMLANLVATIVLSVLMVMKSMMGLMPQLDIIAMLSAMMNGPALLGWVAHLMIGTVGFGIAFALLQGVLPGKTSLIKGTVFGVAAWAMMMIVVMPMAGAGVFGLNLGIMAPVMTLMLHVIYGVVLGIAFGKLTSGSEPTVPHVPG